MKFSDIYYDPEFDEVFTVAPASINRSYMEMGAEGYVKAKFENGRVAWIRKRSHWVLLN